jgi:NAD(P)-dependent dehydrogenase (short-subunit alcohol dehydrogenase family)
MHMEAAMSETAASNTLLLAGQVALVTGASSGLGRATALALAHAGADIGLFARSANELQQVAGAIERIGRRALAVPIDLANGEQLVAAVAQTVDMFSRVDVLVNAAGTDVPGHVVDLPIDGWDRVLDVNLRAPFILAKAVFPYMQQAGRDTIINISSVAGKRGWANAAAYCASKFGLTGFTLALAAEGKPQGVRACILYPGGMATSWGAWSSNERQDHEREPQPSTRALPPDRVAALIVWPARHRSSCSTKLSSVP